MFAEDVGVPEGCDVEEEGSLGVRDRVIAWTLNGVVNSSVG